VSPAHTVSLLYILAALLTALVGGCAFLLASAHQYILFLTKDWLGQKDLAHQHRILVTIFRVLALLCTLATLIFLLLAARVL
jgi:hypothetical protein